MNKGKILNARETRLTIESLEEKMFDNHQLVMLGYTIALVVDLDQITDAKTGTVYGGRETLLIQELTAELRELTDIDSQDVKEVSKIVNQFCMWRKAVANGDMMLSGNLYDVSGIEYLSGVGRYVEPSYLAAISSDVSIEDINRYRALAVSRYELIKQRENKDD